jgi:hypothetical protein
LVEIEFNGRRSDLSCNRRLRCVEELHVR